MVFGEGGGVSSGLWGDGGGVSFKVLRKRECVWREVGLRCLGWEVAVSERLLGAWNMFSNHMVLRAGIGG